jgi:translocation and assembly module TamA
LRALAQALAASAAVCVLAIGVPARAAQPKAAIEGDLDPLLRAEIVRAVGDSETAPDNRFEARRRAQDAANDAAAVLRSEGYYAYQIDAGVGDEDQARPALKITAGPRFKLTAPKIVWEGASPPPEAIKAALGALALTPGAPGRSADVVAAEGRALAALRKRGYADAAVRPREVVVDHADRSVTPTYRIAAGAVSRLDGIELAGQGKTRAGWVSSLAPWRPGQAYDPDLVAELERRLLETGVYDSVTVGLAPPEKKTPDGLTPIVVSLAERKHSTIELGASYDSIEGPGADIRWTRYNVLGAGDTLTTILRGSHLDSRLEVDLSQPDWRRPQETLTTAAAVYDTTTDAYSEAGVLVRADLQRHFTRTSYFTWGGDIDLSRSREILPGTLTSLGRDLLTVAGLAEFAWDRSNDLLNPTRGWRVNLKAEPTLLAGKGTVPYLKVQGQASAYFPFDKAGDTVLAGRIHIGSILNGTVAEIPAPQRFYAGGGGSVRGFAYQAVGPRLPDNRPQGGISLAEASVELRRQVTPDWNVSAFVDAGTVGETPFASYRDMGVGAGVGVAYNLSFGPIRVDLAAPVSGRHGGAPFAVYVNLGQSF